MVTIICEKTGIEFEARTKRTKNHPQIMAWVNEAAKDGWYNTALETIKKSRKDGATTLEQFVADLRQAETAFKEQSNAAYTEKMERERQQKEAKRQRYITNSTLREHGYHWVNLAFEDEEEADAFGLIGPQYEHLIGKDWHLYAADHREVSVRQAMEEIASQGDKYAQAWLAERAVK
jgi:hypothetical protein